MSAVVAFVLSESNQLPIDWNKKNEKSTKKKKVKNKNEGNKMRENE